MSGINTDNMGIPYRQDYVPFPHCVTPNSGTVLFWELPSALNLGTLRNDFLGYCQQMVPEMVVSDCKFEPRTLYEDRLFNSGGRDHSGSPNAVLCSYAIVTLQERWHAEQLIAKWNGQREFQGKFVRARWSYSDYYYSARIRHC